MRRRISAPNAGVDGNSRSLAIYGVERREIMSASAISTVFPSNGNVPARLTFLRSAREKNLLSAAAVPDALTKIIAREEEVFAWLEKSEANHRLFANDP